MVADLTKHLFSLGPEAIEEIAAILQVTVVPSTTTQSTAQSTYLTYCGDRGSKTVKAYCRRLVIARGGSPPIVGGHALCSIAGASYKPRTPHGTKANTPVLATTTTKRPLTKVI